MPLPVLFIGLGVAAATGGLGIGKGVKAGVDFHSAKNINKTANELLESSADRLNAERLACGTALSKLGFAELKTMVNFAGSFAGGAAVGTVGGALAAFGAYGAAQALACASTGTAIASLSGAAATNATLAFFGGGSLAAGGLGMAGGTVVLGGIVAGPALMVMGFIAGHAAKKELEKARNNQAEAIQISSQLDTASLQCQAIRRRAYMFYSLLARLDCFFLPLIFKMEDIFNAEGDDYRKYSAKSKGVIASAASIAVSIKSVLDTPILTDDGLLTDNSEKTATNVEDFLNNMKISI